MKKKIKIHLVNTDLCFASKRDEELYQRYIYPQLPPPKLSDSPTLWLEEAIIFLGLDRTGIKRPDKAIHRLIHKGALNPRKILGRLVFDRVELDRVLANGDSKRGRGRPRGR